MTSAGGLVDLSEAKSRPAALLLSGPAAGVKAAAAAAAAAGFPDAVTFDMGGTSTDVCLVRGGVPDPASQRSVAGFPIRVPALDIHTIGAGGGSIARIDAGGALRVGPESAGAQPGPACYGQGGTNPTVADADLVAGRLPAGMRLPGIGALDRGVAAAALASAALDPEAVIAVVEAAMVAAIRVVSLERGVDPRSLALVAFGGAGPLHACALAEALGMAAVVVPPRAGVLSAVGLLCSSPQADLVRSWPKPRSTAGLDEALAGLAGEACRRLGHAGEACRRLGHAGEAADAGGREHAEDAEDVEDVEDVEVALDCRYAGQGHELTVGGLDRFAAEHERRNGFSRPDWPVEVIALRARARRRPLVRAGDIPPVERAGPVEGPASILEPDCTIHVPAGWTARTSASGAWVLDR
jgi:N-methylhydantoinase A/oxoprolinase/acetone carboxylase beta subunit